MEPHHLLKGKSSRKRQFSIASSCVRLSEGIVYIHKTQEDMEANWEAKGEVWEEMVTTLNIEHLWRRMGNAWECVQKKDQTGLWLLWLWLLATSPFLVILVSYQKFVAARHFLNRRLSHACLTKWVLHVSNIRSHQGLESWKLLAFSVVDYPKFNHKFNPASFGWWQEPLTNLGVKAHQFPLDFP